MKVPTTLIENIQGYSWSPEGLNSFRALCFEGDYIVDTAQRANRLTETYDVDRKIDGRGNILLPGLIDAHGHTLELGYSLLNVDLSDTDSIREAQDRIRQYARQNPEKEWIRGFGWDQSKWAEDRFPSAADIDQVEVERPVWLVRKDGHAGWANTEALRRGGIEAETRNPPDGTIIRDEKGDPLGVLIDQAMDRVEEQIPHTDLQEKKEALDRALARFRSLGLTSVHDACMGPEKYQVLKQYASDNELTTRIYAMIDAKSSFYDEWLECGPEEKTYGDFLTTGSVKFFADGALGSRGAAMLEPYSDDPGNRGLLFYESEELADEIKEAVDAGFQVNTHAIGDRANRTVLDAHEQIGLGHSPHLRHRVEHAQILHPRDISRFRDLNLTASIQPAHAVGDMQMAEARLGGERMECAYAWRKLIDEGVPLAAGSDFPIESANPFYGMHTAVNRQNKERQPPGGWHPEHSLTLQAAFHAYTMGAAYASHQEQLLGSLEQGKKADFVLIDADIFEEQGHNLLNVNVVETWVGGEKVYAID